MEKSYSASYAAAGVDITAGYKAVDLMKQHVARTMNEHCIGGLGGFGGLFEPVPSRWCSWITSPAAKTCRSALPSWLPV